MRAPADAPTRTDWASLFFGAVFAVNLIFLVVYQFFTFRYEVHSDSAVKVLLAEEILRSGQLFPHDWVYANGDVYAVFSHTLALPFIPLFGASFLTHAMVGLVITAALLGVTWRLLIELSFGRWQRLAVMALLSSGVSSLLAENLYGQATYGLIITMHVGVLTLGLAFVRRFAEPRARWVLLASFVVLTIFVTWNNPHRSLAMLTLPLVATCVGVMVANSRGQPWPRLRALPHFWLAVAQVLGFVVGSLLARAVASTVTTVDPASLTMWLPPEGIWKNSVLAVLGVLAQLGGVPPANGAVVSMWGAYETLRLVLGLVLLAGMVKAVRSLLGALETPAGLVALFTALSAALALLFFVFTSLPDMGSPLASARYMVPSLFLCLVLLPRLLGERSNDVRRPWAAVVAVAACCGITTLALPGYGSTGSTWREAMARGNARVGLVKFLQEQHLEYGYATYWNANALTLLSEGKVRVRQVTADPLPVPTRVHGSRQWFRPSEWTGPTFLLYTQQELRRVDRPVLDAHMGAPGKLLTYGDFRILVFPTNLASLPGWSDRAAPIQNFEVTPSSPHRIGKYQPLDTISGSLSSARAEAGELLFGPFLWLAKGHYRVTFDVAGEGEGPLANLQVSARQGALMILDQPFTAQPRAQRAVEFDIATSQEQWVEFRVLTSGAGTVTVWGTRLEKL